jgi:hypothetical protein
MRRVSRLEQASQLHQATAGVEAGRSEREMVRELGVARSSLRDWQRRAEQTPAPAALVAFAESAEGVQWLHRQVMAMHFVITLLAGAGVRLVCEYLELSGLSAFVASSYGAQQQISVALEEAVVASGEQQRAELGPGMPRRQVTVCEDETFHPEICLVGLEPVSNFILLEQYAQNRSAATWTQALAQAIEDLPVDVIQGTSDEAKGLLRHVEKDLGAHHSPDLFHVQHEVAQATGLNLARQVREAKAGVAKAQGELDKQHQAQRAYRNQSPPPGGSSPDFEQRLLDGLCELVAAERQQEQAQARADEAREILHELGAAYHPYDLHTGQAQPTERVEQRFTGLWERLEQLANGADLPTRSRQKIAKARRVTTQLLATVSFFFATLQAKVEALNLTPEIEQSVRERLIPAIYLERVAERSTQAEQRQQLRDLSANLLAPLNRPDHPLGQLDAGEREHIESVAVECADLFQRSSSCVEGRNGQLSLHHHGHHRLSQRKLNALTILHNYHIRRPDGTTAAERFFGRPPQNLFEQVLQHLPYPPRPARKRPPPPKAPYLMPVAA